MTFKEWASEPDLDAAIERESAKELDQTDRKNIERLNRSNFPSKTKCELLHYASEPRNTAAYGVIVNIYGVSTVVCQQHFNQYREQYTDAYILIED